MWNILIKTASMCFIINTVFLGFSPYMDFEKGEIRREIELIKRQRTNFSADKIKSYYYVTDVRKIITLKTES